MNILANALAAAHVFQIAVADMITLAFFFLLRPREYTAGTASDSAPFRRGREKSVITVKRLFLAIDCSLSSFSS